MKHVICEKDEVLKVSTKTSMSGNVIVQYAGKSVIKIKKDGTIDILKPLNKYFKFGRTVL